jgi:O-acetyl-ADP-ribose deacetylase (regulator of RNase III)
MTQRKRLDWLLHYLCVECDEKTDMPSDYTRKRELFKALMNVRPPRPVADDFIRIQDEFLRKETRNKGIVRLHDIAAIAENNKISVWKGDITRLAVQAVVNAANARMLGCFVPGHACIDNAIHTFAGVRLRLECAEIMEKQGHPEPPGQAKITSAYNLPSDFILHTVGPVVEGQVTDENRRLLEGCYRSCLELAERHKIESIAFCCISTGVFRFPNEEAASVAVETAVAFIEAGSRIKRVIFDVFTERDEAIYKKLLA